MRLLHIAILVSLASTSGSLAAQTPSAPGSSPLPPGMDRLAPLIGRWTMESLPAGVALVETCDWFLGGRHVICQMRSRSSEWQRGALTVFSYDPSDSTYAMTAFGSGGQQSVARGRARGDTLIFEGDLRTGTGQKRTLVTIVPRADGFDLTEQEADGEGGWRPSARIRYIPAPK